MNIYFGDDILDSRDIEERINKLQKLEDRSEAEEEELQTWLELREDVDHPAWKHGLALIRDSHFEGYAREFASDIYGREIDEARWPFDCIDWPRAAEELEQDYHTVEVASETYLYRC